MGTQLRNNIDDGGSSQAIFHKNNIVTLSTGRVVVVDINNQSGGQSWFDVWDSTDRVTFTKRLGMGAGGNGTAGYGTMPNASGSLSDFKANGCFAVDVMPNDTIVFVAMSYYQMYYVTINPTTWAMTGEMVTLTTQVFGTTAYSTDFMDVSVNEAGIPTVAYLASTYNFNSNPDSSDGLKIVTMSRIAGAWVQAAPVTLVNTGTSMKQAGFSLSFRYLSGLGSGAQTARPVVFCWTWMTASGADPGFMIYSGTMSDSNATVTGWTQRGSAVLPATLGTSYSSYWFTSMKLVRVFNHANNAWTIGFSVYNTDTMTFSFGVHRGTWDGTTFTTSHANGTSVSCPENTRVPTSGGVKGEANLSDMSFGANGVQFVYMTQETVSGSVRPRIRTVIGKIAGGTISFFSPLFADNKQVATDTSTMTRSSMYHQGRISRMSGDRTINARTVDKYDTSIFIRELSGTYYFQLNPTLPAPGPVGPPSASTQTTSEPNIYADMTTLMAAPPTTVKVEWQFARDSGFTTSVRNYLQADAKYTSVLNTQTAGVYVRMNDVLPLAQALVPSGTWYVRARQINIFGVAGAWTAGQSFTVSHAPVATPVAPSSLVVLQYTTGIFNFSWTFSDAYSNDSQTAYQIICERDDTGGTIFDTGKIVSTSLLYNGTIPAIYKDIVLRWKVRVWDTSDVAGAYSSYATFRVADPPAITTNYPENGGTVMSAIPYVEATPTTTGGRVITNYKIVVTKNGLPHYDSGWLTPLSPIPSGQKIIWSTADFTYTLNADYSLTVYVRDNLNLEVASAPVYYDTDWALPDTPAPVRVDSSKYNTEGYGHVIVQWDGVSDLNLYGWILERRIGIPATLNTFIFEDWEEVYRTTENLTLYEYDDVMVPSGCQVEYRLIKQLVLLGSISNSLPTAAVNTYVESDGYWLIDPTAAVGTIRAFKLANVTSESYSDEYEEAEFNLIGRGRHVDQGDRLGYKGQLVAQLRDSMTSTARAKKLILEDLKKQSGYVYLRNPFGDVFMVYLSTLQVSRISGVGRSEFVDVTIPYSEVS